MKNIGVFFGSRNTEHDVSIITAQLVISGLKGLGHNVIPVYIDREGRWLIDQRLGKLSIFFDEKRLSEDKSFCECLIDLKESQGKLVLNKKGILSKPLVIDLAFPVVHGAYGEDGCIQGLFEMFDLPYIGCDVTSSAVSMDKALTKHVFKAIGINTTRFCCFTKHDWQENKKEIIQKMNDLKYPLFVKPVHLGSSIGMSKVKKPEELEDKIELAIYYDDKVLVEEGVSEVMDVTCCVIGNDEPEASALQESIYSADLFDFEEKYLKGGGSQLGKSENGFVIPARLDKKTTKEIQDAAVKIYRSLGCSGISRIDFLYDHTSKTFLANEVNPLPGTLYHHLWKASGIELDDLLEKLIKFAEEKYEQKKRINLTFKSSIITNLKNGKLGTKLEDRR